MSNRTTVRGTAMTAIGCSAPRLATAVVERPLLYDALIAIADTGWRFDEQTNAGPLCRGASRGASGGGVSHDMSVPHVISGGGTVDLPGCGRPRGVASNPKVGEAGAHNPWKSRGRSLPLVPAVPAARFPQPHSASSSWASIIGNDPCTTRGTCDGQRGLEDYEGMTTHPEYTLAKPSTCLNNRDHFTGSPRQGRGATRITIREYRAGSTILRSAAFASSVVASMPTVFPFSKPASATRCNTQVKTAAGVSMSIWRRGRETVEWSGAEPRAARWPGTAW